MVKYLIFCSSYQKDIVSVSTTNNILEHFLKFRDGECVLQTNLYVAFVKDNYNKFNELPKHLIFHGNKHFYDIKILEHLPDNK